MFLTLSLNSFTQVDDKNHIEEVAASFCSCMEIVIQKKNAVDASNSEAMHEIVTELYECIDILKKNPLWRGETNKKIAYAYVKKHCPINEGNILFDEIKPK